MEEIYEMLEEVDRGKFGRVVRENILKAYLTNRELGEVLINYYKACTSHEEAIVNDTMVRLCGSSFEDLLEDAYEAKHIDSEEMIETIVVVLTVIENNNLELKKAYTGEDSIKRAEKDFKKYTGIDYTEYKERFVINCEDQSVVLGDFVGSEINIMTANI